MFHEYSAINPTQSSTALRIREIQRERVRTRIPILPGNIKKVCVNLGPNYKRHRTLTDAQIRVYYLAAYKRYLAKQAAAKISEIKSDENSDLERYIRNVMSDVATPTPKSFLKNYEQDGRIDNKHLIVLIQPLQIPKHFSTRDCRSKIGAVESSGVATSSKIILNKNYFKYKGFCESEKIERVQTNTQDISSTKHW